jgi:hypothetical protein
MFPPKFRYLTTRQPVKISRENFPAKTWIYLNSLFSVDGRVEGVVVAHGSRSCAHKRKRFRGRFNKSFSAVILRTELNQGLIKYHACYYVTQ